MTWIVFFIYLILFSWLVTRAGFIRRAGISSRVLVFLFLLKVMAGIAYFAFHSQPAYKYRSDTWRLYQSSVKESSLLRQDPVAFITGLFRHDYENTGGLFDDRDSYWNDLKDASFAKFFAVINIFTGDNYYAAIVIFNFLFFAGLILFFRLMKEIYPGKEDLLLAAIFLIPSFLFWCSGIHKDGLIFSAIAISLYSFHQLLLARRQVFHACMLLLMLAFIFFLRNYLVFILVAALLLALLLHWFPRKKWRVALAAVLAGFALFFFAKYLHPALDFPAYLADKHRQFLSLGANSGVNTTPLEPNLSGIVRGLPAAIDLGFFRPHPTETGFMSKLAFAELVIFWGIFIMAVIRRRRGQVYPPVVIACWVFAFLVLLVIGYTVVYSGAVVRYRSLILPLILAPVLGASSLSQHIIKKYI